MEKQELERMLAVGSILRSDVKRVFALISEHRETLRTIEIKMGGGSMSPAIPKGSRIRIQLDHSGSYHAGQIVAFISKRKIIVHRILHSSKKGNYFLTCGDAMNRPDPPVHMESIVGPVIAVQQNDEWTIPRDSTGRSSSPLIRLFSFLLDVKTAVEDAAGFR